MGSFSRIELDDTLIGIKCLWQKLTNCQTLMCPAGEMSDLHCHLLHSQQSNNIMHIQICNSKIACEWPQRANLHVMVNHEHGTEGLCERHRSCPLLMMYKLLEAICTVDEVCL